MKRVFFVLALQMAAAVATRAADRVCVAPGRGFFRIYVDSGGLFGAFGHDHVIEAGQIDGCAIIDNSDLVHSSVSLKFPARALRVVDPKISAEDRASVQSTMENEVLRVSEYPQVVFESTSAEGAGSTNHINLKGNLTIRGKTQPILMHLVLDRLPDGGYRAAGDYKLKQTAFGITPIRLLGGTVRVKDEVRTEFEIILK